MDGRVVVVAMDGSDNAVNAFHWFCKNLRRENDNVMLVYCVEPFNPYRAECFQVPFTMDREVMEKCLNEAREEVTKRLNEFADLLKTSKIKGSVKSCHSDNTGEGIIDEAMNLKASMIVMGSRGLGLIKRTFLGSVSDYVLQNSSVPVVIVRE